MMSTSLTHHPPSSIHPQRHHLGYASFFIVCVREIGIYGKRSGNEQLLLISGSGTQLP
jgi:hypothetical protein